MRSPRPKGDTPVLGPGSGARPSDAGMSALNAVGTAGSVNCPWLTTPRGRPPGPTSGKPQLRLSRLRCPCETGSGRPWRWPRSSRGQLPPEMLAQRPGGKLEKRGNIILWHAVAGYGAHGEALILGGLEGLALAYEQPVPRSDGSRCGRLDGCQQERASRRQSPRRRPTGLGGFGGGRVDRALGQRAEDLVGPLFLVEVLLQQVDNVLLA